MWAHLSVLVFTTFPFPIPMGRCPVVRYQETVCEREVPVAIQVFLAQCLRKICCMDGLSSSRWWGDTHRECLAAQGIRPGRLCIFVCILKGRLLEVTSGYVGLGNNIAVCAYCQELIYCLTIRCQFTILSCPDWARRSCECIERGSSWFLRKEIEKLLRDAFVNALHVSCHLTSRLISEFADLVEIVEHLRLQLKLEKPRHFCDLYNLVCHIIFVVLWPVK